MADFKIYSSSAGSGKTFTLSKEYIKLVLVNSDPRYFKKILAITFTNDAANEMKSRICESLKNLSEPDNTDSILFKTLLAELPELNAQIISSRAASVFSEIIHDYTDFGVKTIDSFINQIVSSFAFDLNLPHNYEIRFDQNVLLKEAVDKLLERIGQPEFDDFTTLFSDFAFSKIDDGLSWYTMADELANFAATLLNEEKFFQLKKNSELTIDDYKCIKINANGYRKGTLQQISSLAQQAINLIHSHGFTFEDFLFKKAGVFGFYQKLLTKPAEVFQTDKFPSNRHIDAFENGKWLSSKDNLSLNNFSKIENQLKDFANEILAFQQQKDKFEILYRIEKNILKLPLLNFVNNELEKIMKYRNEVFLSEFNRWILDIVVKEPVPFIYERIGEKFNHLLIDEFQDTSNSQFFSLLPLVDNALSNDYFNMIVGDPKQAVYRWRGGNIQLMIDLQHKNSDALKLNKETSDIQYIQIDNISNFTTNINLDTNYRSRKEIVLFNNDFFEIITNSISKEYPFVDNVFNNAEQKVPTFAKENAHVEIDFLIHSDDYQEVKQRLKEIVLSNLEAGFSLGDMAVLCRKNSHASIIADFLKHEGWNINSADSLKLNTNSEVKFLVAMLNVLIEPKSYFNQFELLQYFLKIKFNKINLDINYQSIINTDSNNLFDFFKNHGYDFNIEKNKNLNVFELIETIIDAFKLKNNSIALPYIFSFLDHALSFLKKQGSILSDFVKYWDSVSLTVSIQNNVSNAITVTTVHKSKGLEYPIVILPFTNWETEPNKYFEPWYNLDHLNYPELMSGNKQILSAPFVYSKKFMPELLLDQIQNQEELYFVESLNLLYVAFTRPVDKLYIFSPKNRFNKFEGVGQLIKKYLELSGLYTEERSNYILYESLLKKTKIIETENKQYDIIIKNRAVADKNEQLKIKAETTLNIDISTKILFGNLVHAAFENIKTYQDIEFQIQKLRVQGMVSEKDLPILEERIKAVLNHPELHFLYQPDIEIRNEIEIIGKHIKVQRADRVVFYADIVYIIDYKSGEKKDRDLKQIKTYGELFKQMGYSKIQLILVYLDPLDVVLIDN